MEVAFIDKTYLYPNALHSDLRINLSLNADVSENTLPFVSQSINNFSDYDISQTHDWECPSLSPHVLLDWIDNAWQPLCLLCLFCSQFCLYATTPKNSNYKLGLPVVGSTSAVHKVAHASKVSNCRSVDEELVTVDRQLVTADGELVTVNGELVTVDGELGLV